ncbi:MAG: DUF2330 domain-containing protein [Myxococcota bacterium]|nr:DUF2330 domain-containing protein [Myxococcota bacterium]
MSPLVVLLSTIMSSPAQAFCGTYVGGAGGTPTNQTSHVVMVRQGNRTTLTLAGDAQGVAPSFGMMVPVPGEVAHAELLDDLGLIARVDGYAGPRLVSYSCEELHGDGPSGALGGQQAVCGMAAEFARQELRSAILEGADGVLGDLMPASGRYEVDVLTPSSVSELGEWAGQRGWAMDEEAQQRMAPHIDRGGVVVTVSIALDQIRSGSVLLNPLQFAYTSEAMVVPVRLGAIGAVGIQDVVITVITDMADGAVGIANHPEFSVESECMWRDDGPSFDGFYEAQLAEGHDETGAGVAWTTEYVWAPAKCDPCPDEGPLAEDTLRSLGYEGAPGEAVLTRLRVRLDPQRVRDDLVLYPSGRVYQQQQRYILHDASLESDFPVCGEGWMPDPGSCDAPSSATPSPAGTPLLPLGGLLAGLGALLRRRC